MTSEVQLQQRLQPLMVPRAWPIRAYLLAMVSGVAVPLLALSGGLAWQYADAERARIEADAANSAREVAVGLDIMLGEVTATAQVLAGSDALQAGNLAAFHARAVAATQVSGGNVSLRDAESRQVLNSSIPWGRALPTRTSLAATDAEAARTGQPAVSDGFMGIADGVYQFAVVLPLNPEAGPARFLNFSVPATRVQQVLDGVTTLLPGVRAGVVDKAGRFLARWPGPQSGIGQPAAILSGTGVATGQVSGRGVDGMPTRLFVHQSTATG